MGNQGKILGKQSSKMYVFFLHISVLSFIFEKKLLLKLGEIPFSVFTSVSESIAGFHMTSLNFRLQKY